MKNAIPTALDFWQDPQSDIILIYSENECSVSFRCWSDAGVPADFIGQLTFSGAAAVRSFHREFVPYQTAEHGLKSYILKVIDSDLTREHVEYRNLHYPNSPITEKTHFVVVGHDIYHEVLASSFVSTTISNAAVDDPRLLKLISAQ